LVRPEPASAALFATREQALNFLHHHYMVLLIARVHLKLTVQGTVTASWISSMTLSALSIRSETFEDALVKADSAIRQIQCGLRNSSTLWKNRKIV